MDPSLIKQQRNAGHRTARAPFDELDGGAPPAVAAGCRARRFPVYVAEASGAVLVDVDGNSLIDLGSGIAVVSVGHAAPTVVDAVQAQVGQFSHTCFMVNPYEEYVAVCEALNARTPGDHEKRTALFNSGAEAVENAVKVARHVTGRQAVVVFDHAYHGRTNLTMALTAKNMPYRDKFGPFAPEVYRVPMSYPVPRPRRMTGTQAAARADRADRAAGGRRQRGLCADRAHPGRGRLRRARAGLPARAWPSWCRAAGALFVADEIQTGFCRTGDWFACDDESVVPDLITTAKALAGGMPLAAVTGRAELMDQVHPGGLGGTYGGNPVACAAALAAIRHHGGGRTWPRRPPASAGPSARPATEPAGRPPWHRRRPGPGGHDGHGVGSARDPRARRRCHPPDRPGLPPGRRRRPLCGSYGNVIRLLPPLIIEEELFADGLGVLGSAVNQVLSDIDA